MAVGIAKLTMLPQIAMAMHTEISIYCNAYIAIYRAATVYIAQCRELSNIRQTHTVNIHYIIELIETYQCTLIGKSANFANGSML